MCGFVCLWNIQDKTLADCMIAKIAKIAHRGPDKVHISNLPDAPVIMAHCGLSIIAQKDGAQPICQAGDMLVASGEIYNHADLRAILSEAAFETTSDSETILHLCRTDRTRWISRLNGMFAFVSATKDRIIAARDPLGIEPLYVARHHGGMIFASELKVFDGVLVEGIEAIPPGHLYDSSDGWRQWHRAPQGAAAAVPGVDTDRASLELRLVLEAAVAKWMVAELEVGSFLSAGLDSSIIAAIAQRVRIEQDLGLLRTFAAGIVGSPDLFAARAVAEHIDQITMRPSSQRRT